MNQIDPNKRYPTRGGLWARILCVDAPGDFPVIGYIDNGDSLPRSWTFTGRFTLDCESEYDLILTPEKRRLAGWLNVYENNYRVTSHWPTRAEADLSSRQTSHHRIACIDMSRIEYTVGEGLE